MASWTGAAPVPQRGPRRRPQLLSYPDALGGTLRALIDVLRGPLGGLFGGVHVLPPYPSSGDRGFAPITYDRIDPRFGSWTDIEDLARTHEVLLDVMVNHISRHSPEFEALLREGWSSPHARLFLAPETVWPGGIPTTEDLERLFLRRSGGPFSTFTAGDGSSVTVWTTFGEGAVSEQVDLDLRTPQARALVTRWLAGLASHGVAMVRLDAVGYVVKKAGTSSFMVQPEIWAFLEWVSGVAEGLGMTLLPEVHDVPATHDGLARRGHWTYDFALPGLLLHALETGEAARLAAHLVASPSKQVTTLDCHDGIPIRPDLEGILTPAEMRALARLAEERGGNINRIISPSHARDGVDVHQLNLTYFSALGEDEDRYVLARAIQLFARGIPQLYYVGLFAGPNDLAAVTETGEGRAINRHNYTMAEIEAALSRPVVGRLLALVRLRNSHPAFDGDLKVTSSGRALRMRWQHGPHACELEADLRQGTCSVRASGPDGRGEMDAA